VAAHWPRCHIETQSGRAGSLTLTVIVDTNFMTVPAEPGVDVFSEIERLVEGRVRFVVLASVVQEIESRMSGPSHKGGVTKFRVAKDLLNRCEVITLDSRPERLSVDDQLLQYAPSVRGAIATNDRQLRTRARSLGIPVFTLRAKKRVMLEGSIL